LIKVNQNRKEVIEMNWAAFLSFFHPMITCIICGIWVLWIVRKEYRVSETEREIRKTADDSAAVLKK